MQKLLSSAGFVGVELRFHARSARIGLSRVAIPRLPSSHPICCGLLTNRSDWVCPLEERGSRDVNASLHADFRKVAEKWRRPRTAESPSSRRVTCAGRRAACVRCSGRLQPLFVERGCSMRCVGGGPLLLWLRVALTPAQLARPAHGPPVCSVGLRMLRRSRHSPRGGAMGKRCVLRARFSRGCRGLPSRAKAACFLSTSRRRY